MESKEKHLERYYNRRLFAINYLGGKCNNCGILNNLQFDHINPKNKKYNISKILMYKIDTLTEELNKCQLLCEKCHKQKCFTDGSHYKNTARGSRIYGSKLTDANVIKIKNLIGNNTQLEIAKLFGVSRETISSIKNNRIWKHIKV